MYLFYHQIHGIRCIMFRIANPYGPRSQMKHSKYSMINWFIRLAMENKTIKVFGDGSQIRDYIYVDDLAEAFISAAVTPACVGEVFNVGSGIGSTFREMVDGIVSTVGKGKAECVPWPADYINVETGDYVTDIHKITQFTGWQPVTSLKDGISRTYAYHREHKTKYF
jgi:UDP-glucose 4-epimerase